MKLFLKVVGYIFVSLLVCLYLTFLFVVPKKIDLNIYKPEIQKYVKSNTNLLLDFDNVDVVTSPLLEAGVKTKNISLKLPDGSVLFSADSFKGKVFLPSLLWLTLRVTQANVESPKLNIEIVNGEKYKVAKVFEDLINKKRAERRLKPPRYFEQEAKISFIDFSSIKVNVPNINISDYNAVINDTKASHKLVLKGEKLKLGYYDGKFLTLKTNANLLSDNEENITANLDINTFIPKLNMSYIDDDMDAVLELPFVNPVSTYRSYDLKSNIDAKLKIRKNSKNGKIWSKGYLNIDNTTLTLSELPLPVSSFKLVTNGYLYKFDTSLFVTDKEYIKFDGLFNNGKNPYIDFSLKSSQVHFANLLKIAKAYLDTVHIKNDIGMMSASGYMLSNFHLKTNFSDIISDGKFVIRNGNIVDKYIGLLFNDINVNINFDDNIFRVEDSHVLINKRPVYLSGKIDSNSIANVNIKADKVPLPELYLAFAPRNIRGLYSLNSGFLTLNAKIVGEIKDIAALFESDIEKFRLTDKKGNFVLSNNLMHFGIVNYAGEISGKFKNEGFKLEIPTSNSVFYNKLLVADVVDQRVLFKDSVLKFNNHSNMILKGEINDYLSDLRANFSLDGYLSANDIKNFSGVQFAKYLEAKGNIPVKAKFASNGKLSKLLVQMQSDINSYITPVKFDELANRQVLFQLLAEKNDDVIKVYKSGLYLRKPNSKFSNNLRRNFLNARQIIGIRAMFSNLSTSPFINIIKLTIPKDLNGSICLYKKSKFIMGGDLYIFGKLSNPKISGSFNLKRLSIPELLTNIRYIIVNLNNKDIRINVSDLLVNGSDFNLSMHTTWDQLSSLKFLEVKAYSRYIDYDKLEKAYELYLNSLPKISSGKLFNKTNITSVDVLRGIINFKYVKSGKIIVKNATSRFSVFNNVLYLNNLKCYPEDGYVNGDVSVNLTSNLINAKLTGKNFEVGNLLNDLFAIKDTLSGKMNFVADISMKWLSKEDRIRSLKGYVDINIKNGKLGPFGKFENFLMAENLRENEIFSKSISSVISNIASTDTSYFNSLYGHLILKNGIAYISPMKTQGNIMSMYILGKLDLLDYSGNLNLRGKIASDFADKLGFLININPVNIIENSSGLNVIAVKGFDEFCEVVSELDISALPQLNKSDELASNFQVVLRGDTRKPLKMIRSFKWLVLESALENAKNYVETIPTPEDNEEDLTVDEIIQLRQLQNVEQGGKNKQLKTPSDNVENNNQIESLEPSQSSEVPVESESLDDNKLKEIAE